MAFTFNQPVFFMNFKLLTKYIKHDITPSDVYFAFKYKYH